MEYCFVAREHGIVAASVCVAIPINVFDGIINQNRLNGHVLIGHGQRVGIPCTVEGACTGNEAIEGITRRRCATKVETHRLAVAGIKDAVENDAHSVGTDAAPLISGGIAA